MLLEPRVGTFANHVGLLTYNVIYQGRSPSVLPLTKIKEYTNTII